MPRPRVSLSAAVHGLTVRVDFIEPNGYCEYMVVAGSHRWGRAFRFPEDTTLATALSHLLANLAEDCNHDLTEYDYLTNDDMHLGSLDLARTLVEQNHGNSPHRMFTAYARDVVPS